MKVLAFVIGTATALIVIAVGLTAVPWLVKDRVLPGVRIGHYGIGGVRYRDLPNVLHQFEASLLQRTVHISVRDGDKQYTLANIGAQLDVPAIQSLIQQGSRRGLAHGQWHIPPLVQLNPRHVWTVLQTDFSSRLKLPVNASLQLTPAGALQLVPSQPGEGIDVAALEQKLVNVIRAEQWQQPIAATIIITQPEILNTEVESAKALASQLLQQGFTIVAETEQWTITPGTISRLLSFTEQADPVQITNGILGVQLEPTGLEEYLTTTLSPAIDHPAQNARFELVDNRVQQFALPQIGRGLNVTATTDHINQALVRREPQAVAVVGVTRPDVADLADIESIGVTTLLAHGESDFAGSPRNRIHNIKVGTARYHGVLIPPQTEFSFNELLGPVNAAAGYKLELVIKSNKTVPEFGGGLCQVSTTLFRAAIHSGLPITARRNHAYPVRYYGKPGFDATIYPPSTDLKFTNDTPNYILVQTKIDGTKLAIEFWGTSDGRRVEVDGPKTYDRRPDGSVKALLTQKILTADGQVKNEQTFYSRYRSPNLFPKVAAATKSR